MDQMKMIELDWTAWMCAPIMLDAVHELNKYLAFVQFLWVCGA